MNRFTLDPKVQICLEGTDTSFNMAIETDPSEDRKRASALQNPELRRLELAAMLRRALKKQLSQKSRRTYWSAFMSSYVRENANNNDF